VWLSLAIVALAACAVGAKSASAAHGEFVPALGISKPVEGDQTQMYGSLALRGDLIPLLTAEVGVAYRSEDRFNDQLHLRQWPVTASLYLRPARPIYAGAGVGWYNTSFDYDDALGIADENRQDFGVHVGGGFQIPVTPAIGLDLSGRYVMMQDQESHLVPEKFDPDFWTTNVGLAIRF
jgi:opacity protein-like surface antigen